MSLQRLPEDLFGRTVGVDIGGVEQGDTRVEAAADEPTRVIDVRRPPRPEELAATTDVAAPKPISDTTRPESPTLR
ncbi:hypothetical protein GCM10009624_13330 [Gordonia sinesedis]